MYEGFVFYESFYDALSDLPDDVRVIAYDSICRYALYGEEPDCSGVVKTVFKLVRPQIDANNKRREAGRKGGQADRKQNGSKPEANESKQEANMKQIEANSEQNEAKEKVKDKVKVKVKDKEKEKAKEKAKEDALTRSGIEPDSELGKEIRNFIDHRKRLRKPMTDHAIDLFIKRLFEMAQSDQERVQLIQTAILKGWQTVYPEEPQKPKAKSKNSFNNFEQRTYDYDELEAMLIGVGT